MRRYDEPPKSDQYYKHRPGAYGIFMRGDEILLTYQAAPFFEWQLPGGGIEAGESPIPALTREAYEETGWKVQVTRKIGAYKRYVYMPDYDMCAEKICHIYIGQAILCLGQPTEPDHKPALVDIETALEIMHNDADREVLKSLL